MTIETVKCDVCGAVKGETNHWFKMRRIKYENINNLSCVLLSSAQNSSSPLASGATVRDVLDLCGEACVIKKVSESLKELQ